MFCSEKYGNSKVVKELSLCFLFLTVEQFFGVCVYMMLSRTCNFRDEHGRRKLSIDSLFEGTGMILVRSASLNIVYRRLVCSSPWDLFAQNVESYNLQYKDMYTDIPGYME